MVKRLVKEFPYGIQVIFSDDEQGVSFITSERQGIQVPLPFSESDWIPRVLKGISFSNHHFSGDMLVFRGVILTADRVSNEYPGRN